MSQTTLSPVVTSITLEEMMKSHPGLDHQLVVKLKEWSKHWGLPESDVALFLLCSDYNVVETKVKIAKYFMMRKQARELFVSREDFGQSDWMEILLTNRYIVELPGKTWDLHRVILAKILDSDSSSNNFAKLIKIVNMIMDLAIWETGCEAKFKIIVEMDEKAMDIEDGKEAIAYTPMKKFIHYLDQGCPLRGTSVHVVKSIGYTINDEFKKFFEAAIVKNDDLHNKSTVFFHKDLTELCKAIGMEQTMLPQEMGGVANITQIQQNQVKKLKTHHAFLTNATKNSK